MDPNDNLKKLKSDIDTSIKTVENIPPISIESFSSEDLKKAVIPILEKSKKRVSNIEILNENIDGIRNEIIKPVNKIIKKTSKINSWLSLFSFLVGIIGVILTINSYFSVHKYDDLVNTYQKSIKLLNETNQKLVKEVDLLKSLNDKNIKLIISQFDTNDVKNIPKILEKRLENDRERNFIQKFFIPKSNHQTWYWWSFKIIIIVVTIIFVGGGIATIYDNEEIAAAWGAFILAVGLQIVSFFFI